MYSTREMYAQSYAHFAPLTPPSGLRAIIVVSRLTTPFAARQIFEACQQRRIAPSVMRRIDFGIHCGAQSYRIIAMAKILRFLGDPDGMRRVADRARGAEMLRARREAVASRRRFFLWTGVPTGVLFLCGMTGFHPWWVVTPGWLVIVGYFAVCIARRADENRMDPVVLAVGSLAFPAIVMLPTRFPGELLAWMGNLTSHDFEVVIGSPVLWFLVAIFFGCLALLYSAESKAHVRELNYYRGLVNKHVPKE